MKKSIMVLIGFIVVASPVWSVATENSTPSAIERIDLGKVESIKIPIPTEVDAARDVSFQSGTKFVCMSAESHVLFDISIVDVGDKEGQVVINDGGVPKVFNAAYTNGRFVFGNFKSTIEFPAPYSSEWVVGRVKHRGIKGKLFCKYGETVNQSVPASLGSRSAFSCIGTQSERMYDLNIIDVGDEEGEVEINAGGAPEIMKTYYKKGNFIFGKARIELNRPYWYDWTIGKAVDVKGLSEPLVCKSMEYK